MGSHKSKPGISTSGDKKWKTIDSKISYSNHLGQFICNLSHMSKTSRVSVTCGENKYQLGITGEVQAGFAAAGMQKTVDIIPDEETITFLGGEIYKIPFSLNIVKKLFKKVIDLNDIRMPWKSINIDAGGKLYTWDVSQAIQFKLWKSEDSQYHVFYAFEDGAIHFDLMKPNEKPITVYNQPLQTDNKYDLKYPKMEIKDDVQKISTCIDALKIDDDGCRDGKGDTIYRCFDTKCL